MEFNEKLLELRKSRGLTQEELAADLYVSRTAISKWESGRGYPGIDSLKELSRYFSVSLDELLSGEELIFAAEDDRKQKEGHLRDMVFGLLDCGVAMLFFLPFFGQRVDGLIQELPLPSLTQLEPYVMIPYYICTLGLVLLGVLTLALQNCSRPLWQRSKRKLSLGLSAVTALLFILSMQPYAAMLCFLFLTIKALMLINWA